MIKDLVNKAAAFIADNKDFLSMATLCSLNLFLCEKSSPPCLSPTNQNPAKGCIPLPEIAETMSLEKPLIGKLRLDNRIYFTRTTKIVNLLLSVLNKTLSVLRICLAILCTLCMCSDTDQLNHLI